MKDLKIKGTTSDILLGIDSGTVIECLYIQMRSENELTETPIETFQWLDYEELVKIKEWLTKAEEKIVKAAIKRRRSYGDII